MAGRRASRAVRPGLLQAGRFADRRQGQVPDLPGGHHRQPAQDHRVGAEEGGAGRPYLVRLRLGPRQDRGDLRRLCRLAAGRGAAALDLCRWRHRAVAAVAHGEVQRRGAALRLALRRDPHAFAQAHPHARGPEGPQAPDVGRLGRDRQQPRRLDGHPAGRRGLSGARARRRRRHRMGDARHQYRAGLPQGRQVHHPARRSPAGRGAGMHLRQGAVGRLRCHHQEADRSGRQALHASNRG